MKHHAFCLPMFLVGLAEAAVPLAQSPWARVPAFPSGCYSAQDDFAAKITAAQATVTRDIAQLDQSNNELKERAKNADVGDPAARAARVQSLLMKDPQAAMKMMQQSHRFCFAQRVRAARLSLRRRANTGAGLPDSARRGAAHVTLQHSQCPTWRREKVVGRALFR